MPTTSFSIPALKVEGDASELAAGEFFLATSIRTGAIHPIGVRCADYNNSKVSTILLFNPEAFDLVAFGLGRASGKRTIRLDLTEIRIELPPLSRSVAIDGSPGMLVVNAEGAHLCARLKDPNFDRYDSVYVSLSDWRQSQQLPHEAIGFTSWKLVATQQRERVVLYEA